MADPLDLAEIEKLLAAATPGEWESRPVSGHRTENEARYVCRKWDPAPWWIANVLGSGCGPFSRSEGNANADLIAALRNAAPSLISRLRVLEKMAAAAKELRDTHREYTLASDAERMVRLDLFKTARDACDAALKEAGL